MGLLSEFKKNLREERAHLKGEAQSQGRLIQMLRDFTKGVLRGGPARQTNHAFKYRDGSPMVFFSDGSLRHFGGHRLTGRAAKRQQRRMAHTARMARRFCS